MKYALLISVELILEYAVYLFVIVVSLVVLGILKRRNRRALNGQSVKTACEKAKRYAEKLLSAKKVRVLASARLAKLSSYVAEAEWLATQIVEETKNIAFEGISSTLDGLANALSLRSEDTFLEEHELASCVRDALKTLDELIAKLEKTV